MRFNSRDTHAEFLIFYSKNTHIAYHQVKCATTHALTESKWTKGLILQKGLKIGDYICQFFFTGRSKSQHWKT